MVITGMDTIIMDTTRSESRTRQIVIPFLSYSYNYNYNYGFPNNHFNPFNPGFGFGNGYGGMLGGGFGQSPTIVVERVYVNPGGGIFRK